MGKKVTKKEKREMLENLAKLSDMFGRQPSHEEINECSFTQSKGAYCWHFGTVENALSIVRPHLIRKNLRQKYTDDELFEEFYKVKKMLGKCPTFEEMKKHAKYHPCIMMWRFGSWNKFLKLLGETVVYNVTTTFKNKKRTFIANDGHICRSKKEVEIDNLLYELNIPHDKEVLYPFDALHNKNTRKSCDWFIDNTYVEYCGMVTYYDVIARNKYRKALDEKANMCFDNGWNFIHILPDNMKNIKQDIINIFGGK